jgi:hypothetical protein
MFIQETVLSQIFLFSTPGEIAYHSIRWALFLPNSLPLIGPLQSQTLLKSVPPLNVETNQCSKLSLFLLLLIKSKENVLILLD